MHVQLFRNIQPFHKRVIWSGFAIGVAKPDQITQQNKKWLFEKDWTMENVCPVFSRVSDLIWIRNVHTPHICFTSNVVDHKICRSDDRYHMVQLIPWYLGGSSKKQSYFVRMIFLLRVTLEIKSCLQSKWNIRKTVQLSTITGYLSISGTLTCAYWDTCEWICMCAGMCLYVSTYSYVREHIWIYIYACIHVSVYFFSIQISIFSLQVYFKTFLNMSPANRTCWMKGFFWIQIIAYDHQ